MVITVTGSTGTIGSELVRLLSDAGAPTRAVFRNTRGIRPLSGVVWLQADLRDAALLEPALAGTTRLFLLTDNTPGFGRLQIAVLRAAESLGVEHVVKLSALGASNHSNSTIAREHWEVEQALQQSAMTWTILRPHAFMQNWLGDVAESVRAERIIYSPIGDGRVPFIDTRDIAAVAAEALLHPDAHTNAKYFLTGGEAVGYAELAAALSEVTGADVRYQPIAMPEARARLEARGVPPPTIDATLAIAAYQKAGGPTAKVSDRLARILDWPPRTIRDFARDHASEFGAGA
ncbi:MAG: SDR family oxidoreductase [Longimicrobiales bacterium]